MDWQRLMKLNNNKSSPIFVFLFAVMAIYYVIAIIFSYKAYQHYKVLFLQQVGIDGYGPGGFDPYYDDEQAYQDRQR